MRFPHFPRTREDIAAIGYVLGWKVVGLLPQKPVLAAAMWAADRAARGGPDGRGPLQLRKNLARVIGAPVADVPDGLVRASMRSYLRYWVEAFRLPRMVGPEFCAALDRGTTGAEYLDASLARGKGVVLVVTHSGNWDAAGTWLNHHTGGDFWTVAERLKPESLYEAFVEYRESLGFHVLPLTGGGDIVAQLRAVLSDGGIVCLLGDRDFGGNGVPVTFFGEQTTMPAGPAKLAVDTDCALHVCHVSYPGPGRWALNIHPPIEVAGRSVPDIVTEQARYLEADIAAHPADWHMLQPIWPADRRKKRQESN
ncbi:phosphatidylinositol mannoside acyltransferase [Corynebacterium sp. TAE3-ERU12]|uniref:phosphatidylinositol mannoside acyltransferase n=1 Tax=Corynebacterium sp. TAE3-ERU12 TaxID=2849491 RepID=UPI001C43BB22|nr:phosphatidylinositol mannoside acyltransferase [Corynebacterium sp. TAE3-ERU12]MBV7295347.1 phosphatidylinositol mannoside acyltransferase [Corynebacterium sp. TAE3-ERU12]